MSVLASVMLDKRRKTKRGYPIKLRITVDRESLYISLRHYISLDDFNKVTKGQRVPKELRGVRDLMWDTELKARNIISQLEPFDFDEFRALFLNKTKVLRSELISDLFDVKINELEKNFKLKSASIYKSTQNALNSFKHNVKIGKIDSRFLKAFEKHLISRDLSITTISIYMRNIRAVINANRDMVIKYPFQEYRIPTAINNKRALKPEQLEAIFKFKFNKEPDDFYLHLFKLSFYLGGVNIKDIALMKSRNIKNGYLVYNRSKTNVPVKTYILEEAEKIIAKYRTDEGEYLFPLLTGQEPDYLLARTHSIIKSINRRLKRVCENLEIPKITTYSARHSFATILMNKGVGVVFISKTLGHASIKTTEDYLGSFTDEKMQENMYKLISRNKNKKFNKKK